MNVLVVDAGGTHVKILATGQRTGRELESGPTMTPKRMVTGVRKLATDWEYDVVPNENAFLGGFRLREAASDRGARPPLPGVRPGSSTGQEREGVGDAARDDRPGTNGREHGAATHQGGSPVRGL